MVAGIATRPDEPVSAECWCCGTRSTTDMMVHLGNHPEVTICVRCSYAVRKWAWEIEDRSRTGPLAAVRARVRMLRTAVVRRGWQHNSLLGGPIRWLGKRLP